MAEKVATWLVYLPHPSQRTLPVLAMPAISAEDSIDGTYTGQRVLKVERRN
jgi:hypothetical protein